MDLEWPTKSMIQIDTKSIKYPYGLWIFYGMYIDLGF